MTVISTQQAGGQNVCAFLDMIAVSEIGQELLAISDNGYNVLVGSTPSKPLLFQSYADHPDVFNAACDSDAAGRYQIMHRWWPDYKRLLNLLDFSPLSQDLYAIQQLRESHALPNILAGNFHAAVAQVAHIWASLPGANYNQHENKLTDLQAAYVAAGGTVQS